MKQHLKTIISLTAICAVISILLAITNHFTAPIIKNQENAAANEALKVVLPDGEGFELVDMSKYTFPSTVKEVYSEKNGGYVFKLETSGYADGFIIMCGINKDGTVVGSTCIGSNETNGAEKDYGKNFEGKTLENADSVDTVAGSTLTTNAYKSAVNDALKSFAILGGAEVDTRTDEEILAEGLNTALPSAKGKFTIYYMANGFSVYKADNGKGYVFKYEDSFVAVNNDGIVKSDIDKDIKTKVSDLAIDILESKLTKVKMKRYKNLPKSIEKAYITPGGNLVFFVKAAGYGINGGNQYHPASGEYIYITVFANTKGEIISCVTTRQAETQNIGSVCADPEFSTKFNGKTKENYNDVDAISGATITTDGYKKAIGDVFKAINLVKGEAK